MSEAVINVRKSMPPIVKALGGFDAFWFDKDRRAMGPLSRTWFLLKITRWNTGFYQLTNKTVEVEGEPKMVLGITGYKDFRLEIRAESNAQDDDMIAFNPMDDFMTGIRADTGKALMLAAGFTLIDFEGAGALDVNVPIDDRIRSHAVLEANFRASFCIEEEPNDCWIQKAAITAKVSTCAGELVTIPPDWESMLIDGLTSI